MNHYLINESDKQEILVALEATGTNNRLAYGIRSLKPEQRPLKKEQLKKVLEALKMAVRQNGCDMLMTGAELRKCEEAIELLKGAL